MSLRPGDVISDPRWPEPVEITMIEEEFGDYLRIVGVTVTSRQHVDQLIPVPTSKRCLL